MYQILIADSEERHMKKIRKILEVVSKEYCFSYASTPETALCILEQGHIDVFICELELPVMSGEEMFFLCRQISPDTVQIGLSPAMDIRKTLASVNRTRTFKLILKPCRFADDILLPVKDAVKMKEARQQDRSVVEERRRELEKTEREYEAVVKKIQERKSEYGIILDLVSGLVKSNLKMREKERAAKVSTELTDYIREIHEAFIKYYILEPRDWEMNERLLLEEFHKEEQGKRLKIENLAKETVPESMLPGLCYALYMLLELISTQIETYQISVLITEKEDVICLSFRCNLDAGRDENGRMRYRMTNRENFETVYRSTVQTLRFISSEVLVDYKKNPYAMEVLFRK